MLPTHLALGTRWFGLIDPPSDSLIDHHQPAIKAYHLEGSDGVGLYYNMSLSTGWIMIATNWYIKILGQELRVEKPTITITRRCFWQLLPRSIHQVLPLIEVETRQVIALAKPWATRVYQLPAATTKVLSTDLRTTSPVLYFP